ncbi:MAG: pentapeptide repeat-containing protein [Actinophytocola sp.]|uniref:pentapeptide repeat-containing protein n=1 Tax=Actinophytocola sp. TaxID=1872138 RepID=UPI003C7767A2
MRSRGRDRHADASAGSMTLSILGWLVVALLVGAGTSALLLWVFGWPSLPSSAEFTAGEVVELLKIVLAVIAGFGGVVLLSVNHRKQRVAEGDHRLALRQEEREKSKLLNERFAAAAEQLAHERAQVRLAGVYALAGLADDWDEGRQRCVEVLIAYLRLSGSGETDVVDTIFRMFRERLTSNSPWCDVDFDFTGMKLIDMDFGGFTFRGTVTLDDVTFSGERTSFADTRFRGQLRCHATVFGATMTDFRDAVFRRAATFRNSVFSTVLELGAVRVDGGRIEFEHCVFERRVRAQEIIVDPGMLRFDGCVFENAPVNFEYGQFGSVLDDRRLVDRLRGRAQDWTRGSIHFVGCVMERSPVTLVNIYVVHGRVVLRDLVLERSNLWVKPVEVRYPSFDLRRIEARNAEVEVPLPNRIWRGRAVIPDDTPRPSERDGHGGVGQDGADVREEL